MRTLPVVMRDPCRKAGPQFQSALKGVEIDAFIFERPPQALDEDIVQPAVALLLAGSDHLRNPGRYLPMLPGFVPWPSRTVAFTGLCEIAGAIGLLLPQTRMLAGWALALYFVCVFPANVRNALQGLEAAHLPSAQWYYWFRLPFQPLAIWWALLAGGAIRWPFQA